MRKYVLQMLQSGLYTPRMGRSYSQYCPMAHALDLVGERWSLLVVRELVHGPLRYSDLIERLQYCSTNALATRLRELEAAGVIMKRRLPPPAASMVYELTEIGMGLRPVLAALARWGARLLGPPEPGAQLHSGWLAGALAIAVVDLAPDARITFRVGAETASLDAGSVVDGELEGAAATIDCETAGFYHFVVSGDLAGLTITGDTEAVARLGATLVPAAPTPEPIALA